MTTLFKETEILLKKIKRDFSGLLSLYYSDRDRYENIKYKISQLSNKIDIIKIEEKLNKIENIKKNDEEHTKKEKESENNTILVKKENKVLFVLGNRIEKIDIKLENIKKVKSSYSEIKTQLNDAFVDKLKKGVLNIAEIEIDTFSDFIKCLNNEDLIIVDSKSHSYRYYNETATIIVFYVANSIFYLDCFKNLEILNSISDYLHNKKILMTFDSSKSLKFFFQHYYEISSNYLKKSVIYVDWRIRPINETLTNIIRCDIEIILSALIDNRELKMKEVVECEPVDILQLFQATKLSKTNFELFCKMLKLRDYLAKEFNESPDFIITIPKISALINFEPKDEDDIKKCLNLMSPVVRSNIKDFLNLFTLRDKFSIKRLKTPFENSKDVIEDINSENKIESSEEQGKSGIVFKNKKMKYTIEKKDFF